MTDKAEAKVRALARAAQSMRTAVKAGAEAYANGVGAEKPIVDRHFTAGNQQRYGWAPLSEDYERWKNGITVATKGGVISLGRNEMLALAILNRRLKKNLGAFKKLRGQKLSQEEEGDLLAFRKDQMRGNAESKSRFISELANGRQASKRDKATGGLPLLVLTGALRAAVVGPKHAVTASGDGNTVTIRFAGLPEYAAYLHTGEGTPQRSPVAPNEADRAEVIAAMRRYMDAALRTGGTVPVSSGPIPGKARMV